MLIDEKINSLQNLIKRKITYEELAPILGVESGNAIRNWKYRKRPLKDFEIQKIDDAFNIVSTEQNKTSDNVTLDYYPDIIRDNDKIKNKCAYWASLNNEVKQEYIQKDLQLKEKKRNKQISIKRIRQRELHKEKERQELIAECNKPLSEQYNYDTALRIIKNLMKIDKSLVHKGFPKKLATTFNIEIDSLLRG